ELWAPFLGRILERELGMIAKLENRHRGEALRHRRDAKHGVAVDGRLLVDVAKSGHADVRDFAVDHDRPDAARDVFPFGVLTKHAIDLGEGRRKFRQSIRIAEPRRLRGRGSRHSEEYWDENSKSAHERWAGYGLPSASGQPRPKAE